MLAAMYEIPLVLPTPVAVILAVIAAVVPAIIARVRRVRSQRRIWLVSVLSLALVVIAAVANPHLALFDGIIYFTGILLFSVAFVMSWAAPTMPPPLPVSPAQPPEPE